MPSFPTLTLSGEVIASQAVRLVEQAGASSSRFILGIAGIAGSGKSTLAERLVEEINQRTPGVAEFIPMDGFHLRNAELDAKGWRGRKGAVFTYDAAGYIETLERFIERSMVGGFPEYCRVAHEPVPSTRRVTESTRIIVTEGQYLLSPDEPWDRLASILSECWWLDVSPERARAWLMKRDTFVGRSPEEAEAKYQRNDKLNTEYVLAAKRPPDRIVKWPELSDR